MSNGLGPWANSLANPGRFTGTPNLNVRRKSRKKESSESEDNDGKNSSEELERSGEETEQRF